MANFKFVKSATALVLGASVLTSAVVVSGADASAKTTYKVTSKGTLVNAKTNKAIKGYKSYKGKLYSNGKKLTGLYNKKYYYKNGVKATGTYAGAYYYKGSKKVTTGTYNGAYYVKGVKKVTSGTYNKAYYYKGKKVVTTGLYNNHYYKYGVKATGTYKGAYYYKGYKKVTTGLYNDDYYKNGVKATGTYNKAYYVKGEKVVETGLYDSKFYKDGVLNVGLALYQDKLYNDAALANGVFAFNNDTNAYENGVVVPTSVASASADNQTTITLSGAALGKLQVSDIKVAGVEVTSVTPSADWKTATVALKGTLPANTDVKVSVKDKDFTVNYGLTATKVEVQSATFDDNTANQKLAVLVNGVATSVDYLKSNGYDVTFTAYNKDGDQLDANLFGANTSTSGKLQGSVTEGDYQVRVTIIKGSTILTSDKVAVKVLNLDNAATAINSYELTANGSKLNSNTLVFGETASVSKLTVGTGSTASELSSGFKVTSSNKSVVSVSGTNITAQGIGTADVTFTVGKVSKTVTITVKGETRKVAKVTPESYSTKAIVGGTNKVEVIVTDQYGDPVSNVAGSATLAATLPTSITGLSGTVGLTAVDTTKGKYSIDLPAVSKSGETGTVLVKKVSNGSVLGSFTVTTTGVNNVTSKKLEITSDSDSKDNIIDADIASDNTVKYEVVKYTSEGVKNGVQDLTGYTVKFNKDVVSVDGDKTGSITLGAVTSFTVAIEDEGSTTIAVYDAKNNLVGSTTVTAKATTTKITGVGFKATATVDYSQTINYKDVLDVTEAATGNDDIVKGLTLSNASLHNTRINASGEIYIDNNDNGSYDLGTDTVIGTLKFNVAAGGSGSLSSSSTGGNGYTGVNVSTNDKGTVTFYITDLVTSSHPVVATKAVEVNVK